MTQSDDHMPCRALEIHLFEAGHEARLRKRMTRFSKVRLWLA